MFKKTLTLSSLLTVSVALATGCGEPQEEGMEDLNQEPTAQTASALCTDGGAANHSAQLILGDVGGSVYSLSPSASYGTLACTGRYVVEATGTQGKPNLAAQAMLEDTGLSQATCGAGRVAALFYGLNPVTNTWVQIGGEIIAAGQWVPSPFGSGGTCQVAAVKAIPSTHSKVRVAAKAYIQTVFGPITKKVSGTISAHH
jgi:hypothetical protein